MEMEEFGGEGAHEALLLAGGGSEGEMFLGSKAERMAKISSTCSALLNTPSTPRA